MPNYDYECPQCGKRFEVFQSMNDAKLTVCQTENCEGQVKRLLGTGGGILFKGSGFYQTDYRSSSYQADSKADGGSPKSDSQAGTSAAPGTSGSSGAPGASAAPAAPAAPAPKAAD